MLFSDKLTTVQYTVCRNCNNATQCKVEFWIKGNKKRKLQEKKKKLLVEYTNICFVENMAFNPR